MPVVNPEPFAMQEATAVIRRDRSALTRSDRRQLAAMIQNGKQSQQSQTQQNRQNPNPRGKLRINQRAENSQRRKQNYTQAAREATRPSSLNTQALLHQTMEPVSALPARIPATAFMQPVGTALARTVVTTSSDYSEYSNVNALLASHLADRNGIYALQDRLEIEPFVVLRDPVVSHIVRTFPDGILVSPPTYQALFGFEGMVGSAKSEQGPIIQKTGLFGISALTTVPIPLSSLVHMSGSACYGDTVACGQVGDARVVWLDCPARVAGFLPTQVQVRMEISTDQEEPSDNGPTIRIWRHTSEHTKVAVGGGNMDVTDDPYTYETVLSLVGSGYYSFELVFPIQFGAPSNTNVNWVCTELAMSFIIRSSTTFKHVTPPALTGKEDIVRKARVNGASLLLQNTSALQAQGGTVYAAQLASEVPWYDAIRNPEVISSLNPNSRYVGRWEKGFYGYCKPQGSTPLDLEDVWADLDDPIEHTHMPMFKPFRNMGTVVVMVDAPAPLGGTFSPTVYTAHFVRIYEFITNDQFFDVETCTIPIRDFDEYIELLGPMPQFYENPLHLAAIATLLAQAASLVVRYGPAAVSLAKAFFVGRDLYRKNRIRGRAPSLD